MTSNTLSNAQRRILTEAGKQPQTPAELFAGYLPAGARIKVLAALQKNGLLEKIKDGHYITRAGYAALGAEPPKVAAKPTPRPSPAKPVQKTSKQATMLAMLEAGTTIAALMEATGWQKHSVHGAMANLKKKQGLSITRSHAEGADRLYKIA